MESATLPAWVRGTGLLMGLLLATSGCLESAFHDKLRDVFRDEGTLLKTYRDGNHIYVVGRMTHYIEKYEIFQNQETLNESMTGFYQVDLTRRICRSRREIVPCASLAMDPDLAPYITWKDRPQRVVVVDDED